MNNLPLEIQDGTALLTINRPKSLNALNSETLSELDTCLPEIEKREDVKVVISTGSGGKSLVAGTDVSKMANATLVEGGIMGQLVRKALGYLEEMPQVAIAAMNGYTLGGDCEISMACDTRIAFENTKSVQPECGLGILPGFGDTQCLSCLIGKGRAEGLIFTCNMVDVQEAYHIGLANKAISLAELTDYYKTMAGRIMKSAPIGVMLAKEAISTDSNTDLNSGLKLETNLFGLSLSTQDKRESITASLEKRREKHFIDK